MKNTTVTIDQWTGQQIHKLSQHHGVTKLELLSKVFEYFNRTGIDPMKDKVAINEIGKLTARQKDIIAFIRNQEKTILLPMVEKIDLTLKSIQSALPTVPKQTNEDWKAKHDALLVKNKNGSDAYKERNTQYQKAIEELKTLRAENTQLKLKS